MCALAGTALAYRGAIAEAEADFTTALAVAPNCADALRRRAQVRAVRGDARGAADDLAAAAALGGGAAGGVAAAASPTPSAPGGGDADGSIEDASARLQHGNLRMQLMEVRGYCVASFCVDFGIVKPLATAFLALKR